MRVCYSPSSVGSAAAATAVAQRRRTDSLLACALCVTLHSALAALLCMLLYSTIY